jgi:formate hydrogenlyase transcriptional activator
LSATLASGLETVAYQSLLDVSQTILQHRDLNGLFRELSSRLHAILHFDFLNLILHDAERNVMRLHILTSATGADRDVGSLDLPPEESPSGWVFLHQQPLIIPDVRAETRWPAVMRILRDNAVMSSCWLPLTTAQHRLGAIVFGFNTEGQADLQVDLMRHIAAQVAVAVDNTINFENAERFQHEAERERDRLRILLEITNTLVSELDIRDLFPSIIACLRRAVPHEYSSLVLLVPGTDQLRLHARVFESNQEMLQEGATTPIEESPAGKAVESRRAELFDAESLSRYRTPIIQRLVAAGVRSVCCVPLITPTRVLGTLNAGSTRPNAFGSADVDFLTQVGAQAAIAIENATAYQKIEELKEQLSKEKLYLEDEIRTDRNFGEIVGDNQSFKQVLDQVATVAATDATVLILGETGTGKELIARAIHELSGRRERTFVKLNCAAIPTGLLESELFGHEKGAFTGAIAQKVGRFELAHQGTLFLDEVGDIPLELQPKLLRALQEHEFERLGGTRTIKIDVRLVAATNRDLTQMISERQFRTDLYYRLSVFPVAIPPLRERVDDIPKLVRYFTQKFARRMNRPIETISQQTMDALLRYSWPGNVRELENLVERAVILSRGTTLEIPRSELRQRAEAPVGDSASPTTLEEAEREHIRRTLEQVNWVVGGANGAASRLGMKRTTLQSKMKKLGIAR